VTDGWFFYGVLGSVAVVVVLVILILQRKKKVTAHKNDDMYPLW